MNNYKGIFERIFGNVLLEDRDKNGKLIFDQNGKAILKPIYEIDYFGWIKDSLLLKKNLEKLNDLKEYRNLYGGQELLIENFPNAYDLFIDNENDYYAIMWGTGMFLTAWIQNNYQEGTLPINF